MFKNFISTVFKNFISGFTLTVGVGFLCAAIINMITENNHEETPKQTFIQSVEYSNFGSTDYWVGFPSISALSKDEYVIHTELKNEYSDIHFTDFCDENEVDSVKCVRRNQAWDKYKKLVEFNKSCK